MKVNIHRSVDKSEYFLDSLITHKSLNLAWYLKSIYSLKFPNFLDEFCWKRDVKGLT